MKIYLAGKVGANDWRHGVVSGLRDAFPQSGGWPYTDDPAPGRFPVLERAILGEHDYVGPFFVSCDHGGFHYDRSHGVGAWDEAVDRPDFTARIREEWGMTHDEASTADPIACCAIPVDNLLKRSVVIDMCLDAIRRADVVFAWIDDPTCYGTIYELGYARGIGKPVCVIGQEEFRDLWFATSAADYSDFTPFDDWTPDEALRLWLNKDSPIHSVISMANGRAVK